MFTLAQFIAVLTAAVLTATLANAQDSRLELIGNVRDDFPTIVMERGTAYLKCSFRNLASRGMVEWHDFNGNLLQGRGWQTHNTQTQRLTVSRLFVVEATHSLTGIYTCTATSGIEAVSAMRRLRVTSTAEVARNQNGESAALSEYMARIWLCVAVAIGMLFLLSVAAFGIKWQRQQRQMTGHVQNFFVPRGRRAASVGGYDSSRRYSTQQLTCREEGSCNGSITAVRT